MGRKPEHDGGVGMLCEVQLEDVQGWKRILRKVHIIVSAFNGFRAMLQHRSKTYLALGYNGPPLAKARQWCHNVKVQETKTFKRGLVDISIRPPIVKVQMLPKRPNRHRDCAPELGD